MPFVNEYRNDRKQRVAKITYTIPTDDLVNYPDGFKRVFSKVILNITTNTAKPFITIDNDIISKVKVKEVTVPLQSKINDIGYKIFIGDEAYEAKNGYEERFIYVGEFVESLTQNMCLLAYDKMFKDLIIVPGINPFINDDNFFNREIVLNIVGSVIGYAYDQASDFFINENVEPIKSNHTNIPMFKEGVVNTSCMLLIPGSDPDTAFKDTDVVEPIGSTGSYVIRGETRPRQFIKLGKMNDFLQEPDDKLLPIYFTYNYSPTLIKMAYAGLVNTGERDVYIEYGS